MVVAITESESGIVQGPKGETIILLPPGPISTNVIAASGELYTQVLVDDPNLGRPTAKLISPPSGRVIFQI